MRRYTKREIESALKELHIEPEDGRVDGNEAAQILEWRAKREAGIERKYDATSIRQHIKLKHFPEGSIERSIERRKNMYSVEAVFRLPLSPKRGPKREEAVS